MSRSAQIIQQFAELSEKSKAKYFNMTPSKNPGNPYHDESGKFVSADDATVASKYRDASSRAKGKPPQRYQIAGWKDNKNLGHKSPKVKTVNGPAGLVCGRDARRQGLDIRCSDGKVMNDTTARKLKASAKRVRDSKSKK